MPRHGIFVETRLRHLLASGKVEARVVAPIPYVPRALDRIAPVALRGSYRVPEVEQWNGVRVWRPRYVLAPKIAMTIAPTTLEMASMGAIRAACADGWDFDVIDAHYVYPDGVAAQRLAARLGKPVVVTARGTDINLIPRYSRPRRLIRDVLTKADRMVAVCQALKDEMVALGGDAARIEVLRNGVDLDRFQPPPDRAALRAELGLSGPVLASVGHLIERKGHHLVIEALAGLPEATLLIAGDGEEGPRLRALAARLGVEGRVRFLGAVAQPELARIYGAADALVLASSREGWANVLLEAMACGTPVVATAIWGTPEVVARSEAGRLVTERSAPALVEGIQALLADLPDRGATRRYAEGFSWQATTDGQIALFNRVLGR